MVLRVPEERDEYDRRVRLFTENLNNVLSAALAGKPT